LGPGRRLEHDWKQAGVIGYLRGTVVERRVAGDSALELVIDVGGVGYRVFVTPRLASNLSAGRPAAGGSLDPRSMGEPEVTLSIHTHVREGAITLYGFAGADERRAFELLLGAHGVGPSLALAVVAVHGPVRLVEIVTAGDVDALTLVPGVGRKTAMRLLVDLKARFDQLDGTFETVFIDRATSDGAARAAGVDGPEASPSTDPGRSATAEVSEALLGLGYGPEEVRSVLRALPDDGTVSELLRSALRQLAPRR
jgi:Holliday junction DNA helicase RuvA